LTLLKAEGTIPIHYQASCIPKKLGHGPCNRSHHLPSCHQQSPASSFLLLLQSSKYNIPITIWLPENYPREAPIAYVVPTANMIIKAGHSCVDRNGQVGQQKACQLCSQHEGSFQRVPDADTLSSTHCS
jgi:hypothetical protein